MVPVDDTLVKRGEWLNRPVVWPRDHPAGWSDLSAPPHNLPSPSQGNRLSDTAVHRTEWQRGFWLPGQLKGNITSAHPGQCGGPGLPYQDEMANLSAMHDGAC